MGDVRATLGIPYARADRFERPVSLPFTPDRHDGFGPAAPQLQAAQLVPGSPLGPIDEKACFTLNVWAPEGASGLPVMVWFHGGSFVTGASSEPVFDGHRLAAEQRVVVVSANYRLGALGFLDTRPLGGDVANLGLHDARVALEWVQHHIEEFGGDTERVTIFGESAGGGMCIHLLASAQSRGLFCSAIVQSGVTDRTLDAATAALVTDALCNELGAHDLDALRTLPVEAILDAQAAVMPALLKPVGMMPFHPMVDGDVLDDRPAAALAQGVAAGIRLLAGTTSDEMRLFLDPNAVAPPRDRLVTRVARYVGVDEQQAEGIVTTYERELGSTDAVWPTLFSDVEMQVPARRVVDAHAVHGPTFTYVFAWDAPGIGAAHGVDIPFTFGNFVDGWAEFVGANDDAERVSAEMRAAWAAFARDGDPGWAPYPATNVFARGQSHVAPSHPLFGRLLAVSAH